MNTEQLEKWIEEHASYSAPGPGFTSLLIDSEDLRALFAGKVLVDVGKDASCIAALEHELSVMQATVSSYKSPGEALRALIDWNCAIAVDPKVNGGKMLVPVEPTEKMTEAGCVHHTCVQQDPWYSNEEISERDCASIYKAMITASQELNGCSHDWVDATNDVVSGADICRNCLLVREKPASQEP